MESGSSLHYLFFDPWMLSYFFLWQWIFPVTDSGGEIVTWEVGCVVCWPKVKKSKIFISCTLDKCSHSRAIDKKGSLTSTHFSGGRLLSEISELCSGLEEPAVLRRGSCICRHWLTKLPGPSACGPGFAAELQRGAGVHLWAWSTSLPAGTSILSM